MVGVCHMRRLCRRRVAKLATPTMAVQNRKAMPFNALHPLSLALLSSSPNGGAEGTSCRREAKSLPYRACAIQQTTLQVIISLVSTLARHRAGSYTNVLVQGSLRH